MNNYEAKLYIKANEMIELDNLLFFDSYPLYIVFGSLNDLHYLLETMKNQISNYYIEINYRNKLMDYYDLNQTKARVELGSIIRSGVTLSDKAIVLMGAIINTNAVIGDYTMIDMNAVIGSGAIIKKNCHIGAGAVIAGVMEPMSNKPVVIEEGVLVGANATVLAGVHIGENAIIGAGSVVINDVDSNTTVAGSPARVINHNGKWNINNTLR